MTEWTMSEKYDHGRDGWTISRDGSVVAVVGYRGGTEPARKIAAEMVTLLRSGVSASREDQS